MASADAATRAGIARSRRRLVRIRESVSRVYSSRQYRRREATDEASNLRQTVHLDQRHADAAAAPPELGTKSVFTPEEAAAWARQRMEQTNADRPARPGDVGAYNDAFFERGRSGVKSRRTHARRTPSRRAKR